MPTDESTGVARFLANKGEGFHHVCFEVPHIADTLTRLAIDGVELIDTVPRKGRRGPGRVPPSAIVQRGAGRADRGTRRPRLEGAGLLDGRRLGAVRSPRRRRRSPAATRLTGAARRNGPVGAGSRSPPGSRPRAARRPWPPPGGSSAAALPPAAARPAPARPSAPARPRHGPRDRTTQLPRPDPRRGAPGCRSSHGPWRAVRDPSTGRWRPMPRRCWPTTVAVARRASTDGRGADTSLERGDLGECRLGHGDETDRVERGRQPARSSQLAARLAQVAGAEMGAAPEQGAERARAPASRSPRRVPRPPPPTR